MTPGIRHTQNRSKFKGQKRRFAQFPLGHHAMDKVAKRRHACGLPVVPLHSLKQRPRQNHPADEKKINLAFCFITRRIMFSRDMNV
nr:hypothetical protein [uncultured Ottowia sp.]